MVEHSVHIAGVTGSNPVPPTIIRDSVFSKLVESTRSQNVPHKALWHTCGTTPEDCFVWPAFKIGETSTASKFADVAHQSNPKLS